MGGVAMLLMIAASGITYGWVPDGGQGVRYIIQIPPDQFDQARRSGELTSRIPSEIQGHVTEVVIQIGSSDVPRILPRQLGNLPARASSTGAVTDASADLIPMQVPALAEHSALAAATSNAPKSLMKPAPQSGGMNFPGGFSMPSTAPPSTVAPPSPLENTQRDAAAFELAQMELAQREQAARELAARELAAREQAARDLAVREQAQRDANSGSINPIQMAQEALATNPNQFSTSGPSTNPNTATNNPVALPPGFGFPADDPRSRINPSPIAGPTTNTNGLILPPFTNEGRSTNENAATAYPDSNQARSVNSNATNNWYDMRNAPPRRPSTDPLGSTGQAETGLPGTGFGQLPLGVTPSATQTRSTSSTWANNSSSGAYDSRLTNAQIAQLPPNGYSFNASGNPIDREGYVLDQYGRRATQTTAASSTTWPNSNSVAALNQTMDHNLRSPSPNEPARQPHAAPFEPAGANLPTRSPFNEDLTTTSASDGQAWGNNTPRNNDRPWLSSNAGTSGGLADDYNAEPTEQMQMQSVFNALLLLSAVINFYLFYWLKNLRSQFKDMVTSKRAAANSSLTVNPT